jgi:hypothetical protein
MQIKMLSKLRQSRDVTLATRAMVFSARHSVRWDSSHDAQCPLAYLETHRRMQHDLPALGAAVITHWAWNRYRVRLCVIAVQHTFGGHLNYNPHLHLMVSAGGLKTSVATWVHALAFDKEEIMCRWRFAVTSYLERANQNGFRASWTHSHDLGCLIQSQAKRKWNVHITPRMSKKHFLAYAGRYVRRLPISQRRILEVTP